MNITKGLLVVGLGVLLGSCGGGGGSSQSSGDAVLAGVVTASANMVIDSDTNDPYAYYAANNSLVTAQAIGNPVMVGGYVTETATGKAGDRFQSSADPVDVYAVDLVAGQSVTLEIADYAAADLDLGLFDSGGASVDGSVGIDTRFETVTATTAGRYYLAVFAFSGASNYVLTVGTGSAPASTLSLRSEFVPGEAVVHASAGKGVKGLVIRAGAVGRPMRVALDSATPVQAKGLLAVLPGASIDAPRAAKLATLYRIKALRSQAGVLSADPNYIMRPTAVPNDPYYAYQWHYPLINLPQAWAITTGTPAVGDVVVAVVDTGVRLSHPDLSGKLLRDGSSNLIGYDFVKDPTMANDGDGIDANPDDPGDDSTPAASSWHGTHVAGTIAAASDNGVGVAGVSWGARIMPVRVLGKGGGTLYDVLQGVRYAAGLSNDSGGVPARRADVINLSLGCLGCYSATAQTVFDQVRAAGVIVVAAAGNEGSSQPSYPAAYNNVVSVSAVTITRALAPYSNYGSTVDVAAPGGSTAADLDGDGYPDGVLSTLVNASLAPIYAYYQGTSMATPHVSGVAALMKAVHPGLTPADFDALLANGALTTDLGAAGRDDYFGYGLIDAAKAVLAAKELAGGATVAVLATNPSRLDFGTVLSASAFEVAKLGSGSLAVASVTDDAGWLAVSAGSVDGDGLGSYTVSVDRAGLDVGTYAATITVAANDGSQVKVPVTLQVAAAPTGVNTGYYWVLLLDDQYNVVDQLGVASGNGQYAYRFSGVRPGTYYIMAGTDTDQDMYLCDDGEACGVYPTVGEPVPVVVGTSRHDLDFSVGLSASPTTTAAGATAVRAGVARQAVAATKKVGYGQ
ncbi:MAG: S8 family serine peptidase [Thiobacillus sp.]|nr:S8 family serine peptidase [Thiobacillus sp.]